MSPRVRQPAKRFQSGSARFNSIWDTGLPQGFHIWETWLPRSQRVIHTNPIRLDPYNFRNTCAKFLLSTFRDSFLAYKSEVVSETICSFFNTLAKMLPKSTTHFVTSQLITSGPPYRESGVLLHIFAIMIGWMNSCAKMQYKRTANIDLYFAFTRRVKIYLIHVPPFFYICYYFSIKKKLSWKIKKERE